MVPVSFLRLNVPLYRYIMYSQSSLMRKQFIVGSFGDSGFGIFVMKLGFDKSKWFL
jgi:hypothetical protein